MSEDAPIIFRVSIPFDTPLMVDVFNYITERGINYWLASATKITTDDGYSRFLCQFMSTDNRQYVKRTLKQLKDDAHQLIAEQYPNEPYNIQIEEEYPVMIRGGIVYPQELCDFMGRVFRIPDGPFLTSILTGYQNASYVRIGIVPQTKQSLKSVLDGFREYSVFDNVTVEASVNGRVLAPVFCELADELKGSTSLSGISLAYMPSAISRVLHLALQHDVYKGSLTTRIGYMIKPNNLNKGELSQILSYLRDNNVSLEAFYVGLDSALRYPLTLHYACNDYDLCKRLLS